MSKPTRIAPGLLILLRTHRARGALVLRGGARAQFSAIIDVDTAERVVHLSRYSIGDDEMQTQVLDLDEVIGFEKTTRDTDA